MEPASFRARVDLAVGRVELVDASVGWFEGVHRTATGIALRAAEIRTRGTAVSVLIVVVSVVGERGIDFRRD